MCSPSTTPSPALHHRSVHRLVRQLPHVTRTLAIHTVIDLLNLQVRDELKVGSDGQSHDKNASAISKDKTSNNAAKRVAHQGTGFSSMFMVPSCRPPIMRICTDWYTPNKLRTVLTVLNALRRFIREDQVSQLQRSRTARGRGCTRESQPAEDEDIGTRQYLHSRIILVKGL